MKPSDLYVGAIDFFANLIPGALVLYPLTKPGVPQPVWWPDIARGSPEGWAVFLITAFLTGHLITAIASVFDGWATVRRPVQTLAS
jgi:hypothetical protein